MMSRHIPRHALERLIAGDLTPTAASDANSHVRTCAKCRSEREALEAERERFLAARPAREFVRALLAQAAQPPRPERRPWRPSWQHAGVLALAAAACLFFLTPHPQQMAGKGTIRLKGRTALEMYVSREGKVLAFREGDELRARDRIALVCTLTLPSYVSVLGIDDRGQVTRYFPDADATPQKFPAGRLQLPFGIELDEAQGEERIFAFVSPEPFYVKGVEENLRGAFLAARASGGGIRSLHVAQEGVEEVSSWFRKRR